MTEAMRDLFRSADPPALAHARRAAGVNGASLRWTPGPDELRLPSCDDEPMPQNTHQMAAVVGCFDGLQRRWAGQRDVFVGTDQFIHRDPDYHPKKNPGKPPIAPDVYVAFGVADRHRGSYVPWEEGKPPDFVLEVVSPSSRKQDADEKPDIYAEMGVREFFLYDPEDRLEPSLSGFELCDGKYKPLPEEELREGVVGVRSKALGLCLCLVPPGPETMDHALRLYDPATGEFLPTSREQDKNIRQLAEDNRQLTEDNRQLTEDKRQLAEGKRQSDAKVAELEAVVKKLRRD